MTIRESIDGIQNWVDQNYPEIIAFTERLPSTDEPKQCVIHLDDDEPWFWIEPGKSRVVNLIMAFRYSLSQLDDNFIESDALQEVSEIEERIIIEPVAGLTMKPKKIRSYYAANTGRFIVMLEMTARLDTGE